MGTVLDGSVARAERLTNRDLERRGASAQTVPISLFFSRARPFAAVHLSGTLTLLFDNQKSFETGHYAFHVSNAECDAIFGRVKDPHTLFGGAPGKFDDGKINHWNGARGVYLKSPGGQTATYWS